jgi:hypothetical protein
MIRPTITQQIIDKRCKDVEVITEDTLDGVGIPYYNELEEEDEMERARR